MAEIIVGAIATVLFEKLASADFMKMVRSEGLDVQLIKWNKTFSHIQQVLADAGQKQITDRSVESWLHDLQDLAYDIDDVLDDLATEAMRRKLNKEGDASSSTNTGKGKALLKFIPTCCSKLVPHNIKYGHNMSSKLDEISTKLDTLFELKNTLGLAVNVNVERSNGTYKRPQETSLVDESKVMGREADKEALLQKLLGNEACNQNVTTMSIVGLGGIGKTTLAKVLYNDEKAKAHFELRAWVCVSEEFDVFNISKVIFQAVAGRNEEFANLDLLHVALKEKLSNKRFLVVLDDVWNENYVDLDQLQTPFVAGAPGSKIIVTTRKTNVASVMNSSEPYNLDVLSEEKALSLFAQNALNEQSFDKHPSLKLYGEGIVKKCGRLPLALITLGRVLRLKTKDAEWKRVLDSEIWNSQGGSQILPALRLSYYDLPPHLKQLFAIAPYFPRTTLLTRRKLFYCGWHKGEFFFRLDDKMDVYDVNEPFEKFRHVSFIGEEYEKYKKFKELQRARGLRTFLPIALNSWSRFNLSNNVLAELLPKLHFIRVLSLSRYLSITEVPQSIGTLKHIRYLNFSRTSIEWLPKQVGDLYNLQSLLLRDCEKLSSLRVSFVKLINLRHLDISNTPMLKKMPLGIGGLTGLQTLSKVIIEGDDGFKISELKGLTDLEGQISIVGLDKVTSPIQAKDANLIQKKGIDDLVMEWSNMFDGSRNHMIECEVLEGLRPPPKLRELQILSYGGTIFPSWVGEPSLDRLTILRLRGCKRCTDLPAVGRLQSLKELSVAGMDGVKIFSFDLPDSFHGIAFPSLEVLKFKDMQGWERWSTRLGANNDGASRSFPRLREVTIEYCPKLVEVSIDLIPSLYGLSISGCSEVVFKSMVGASKSIGMLSLWNIKGLAEINGEVLELLRSLRKLTISMCENLVSVGEKGTSLTFSENQQLTLPLKSLHITNCKNLKLFPYHQHLESLTSLTELKIYNCPSMECSFLCGSSWPPNLRILEIGGIKKPMSEWGMQSYPTSLEFLVLWGENSGVVSFVGNAKDVTSSSFLLPPSLMYLEIRGFMDVESVSEVANAKDVTSSSFLLPPTLTHLHIHDFMDVESVSEVLQHLPRLKELYACSCPNVKDLPETGTTDPSSLSIVVMK
ncbi:hypothetical protein OSB04_013085 [Centaurea solstitialis]|uniref:Uncharacterized protein n=1 Tax=Centaurea solstitialis TaxID=347529 RepID=A0AA38WR25_9ASTR|nr:hypothetical protein OSB04_013085 [Centaurea solstitialis]